MDGNADNKVSLVEGPALLGGPMVSAPRSPKWPAVERAHLLRQPACAVCGRKDNVSVHHKKPFHLFPEHELDPENLITLCEEPLHHHLWYGHLGRWQSYNETVEHDAAKWYKKASERP